MAKFKKITQVAALFSIAASLSSCAKTNSTPVSVEESTPVTLDSDLDGVVFNSKTFTYDGMQHYITVDKVPDDVEVQYVGNYKTEPGQYNVVARFYNKNTKEFYSKTLSATLEIVDSGSTDSGLSSKDANLANVVFADRTIEYNGKKPSLKVENLPAGYTVSYTCTKITAGDDEVIDLSSDDVKKLDVGSYIVYAKISSTSTGVTYNKSCLLKVSAKQLNLQNVYFRNASYAYNGTSRSLKLVDYNGNIVLNKETGILDKKVNVDGKLLDTYTGVVVSADTGGVDDTDNVYIVGTYSNNGKVEAGQYTVSVAFTVYEDEARTKINTNYVAPATLTATLSIVDSLSHTVTFVNSNGRIVKTIENILDGSSIDESLVPDYIPSNPDAYVKVYDESSLTNIREDRTIIINYQPNTFSVEYVIPRGVNNIANPSSYTYIDSDIELKKPTMDDGYAFKYFYYIDESNNEVQIDKIKHNSVSNYTIFAKVEELNANDSGIVLTDKFATYTGSPIEANIDDSGKDANTSYVVYYTNTSTNTTSTTAPTDVGSYQVSVEIKQTNGEDEIKYKNLLGILVISSKKEEISEEQIKVLSNRGKDEVFKDNNGVYSKIKDSTGALVDREYAANQSILVSVSDLPSYIKCTVTYQDYVGNTYVDGVINAGSYLAKLSFISTSSNYEAPDDVYVQIAIAKKKVTLSEDEIEKNIFGKTTYTYLEDTTYTVEAKNVETSGLLTNYPEFKVLKYVNNSVNGKTEEGNRASIYLSVSSDNYEISVDSKVQNDNYYYDENLKAIVYKAEFNVVDATNVKSVTYVYKSSSTIYSTLFDKVQVELGTKVPGVSVTEEVFNKMYRDGTYNNNYYYNDYDWVLVTRTESGTYEYVLDANDKYISYKDYTISVSDPESGVYFMLLATKKTFNITYKDDTGLIDETTLAYLNQNKNTIGYGEILDLNNIVGIDGISDFNTTLYTFNYFYTDVNNPLASKISDNQISYENVENDFVIYLYATVKNYTDGYRVTFSVLDSNKITIDSTGGITYVASSTYTDLVDNSFTYDDLYVGINSKFRTYTAPSVDGKKFRGWFLLDSSNKLNVTVTSQLTLDETIISNNNNKFGDGVRVFGIFDDEEYDIIIDLGNGTQTTAKGKYRKEIIGGDTTRENIIKSVRSACPAGYSNDISTIKFYDGNGSQIDILNESYVYPYTENLILSVVYQPRVMQFNFILPATPRNNLGQETISTLTQQHGDYYNLPENASRIGYTLQKWQFSINGVTYSVTSSSKVDLSLFAQEVTSVDITAVFTVNEYTITCITSGDDSIITTTIKYGDEFDCDTYFGTPLRSGYVFESWYYGNNKLKDLLKDNKYTFTTDIIIYAHYRAKKYTLRFYNGNSELNMLTGYFAQYGSTFALPEDNGYVTGKSLEGYYLDKEFTKKITSNVLCADDASIGFTPSSLTDRATINIYARYVPKVYNMTLIMDTYTDPTTLKTFKTVTVPMQYGVTGNLYKYLNDNYAVFGEYSGPYTAGKVFKAWNLGNSSLDMTDTNLTYTYAYDITLTCQYTGKSLGNTEYYWLADDGYKGQMLSAKYDARAITSKEALYGESFSTVTLTETDAKNAMLNALASKVGLTSFTSDASISNWYYLKDGEEIISGAPIDLSQWVLIDNDSIISSSKKLTLLCLFTRPSYPFTVYDTNQNLKIDYTITNGTTFSVHNKTPYNLEMYEASDAKGDYYQYKFYEIFFDESGNRIPNTPYVEFKVYKSDDYTFDGRSFNATSSENGQPVQLSLYSYIDSDGTKKYQLTKDYQTYAELKNDNYSYLNGFTDASNLILSPVLTERNGVAVDFYALDGDNYYVFSHTAVMKGNSYVLPTEEPSSVAGRLFKGWYLWTESRDPTLDDSTYHEGDAIFQPGGTLDTYDDSRTIKYIAKYEYNTVYLSYKIENNIVEGYDVIIKDAESSGSLEITEVAYGQFGYKKFKLVDASGNIYKSGIEAGTSLSYVDILSTGKSRLYLIPDDSVSPIYYGVSITYRIHNYDTGLGTSSSGNSDNGQTSLHGPYVYDVRTSGTIHLFNPYEDDTSDESLRYYGFTVIYYDPVTKKYVSELDSSKIYNDGDIDNNPYGGRNIILEGYQVYKKSNEKYDPQYTYAKASNFITTDENTNLIKLKTATRVFTNMIIPSYVLSTDETQILTVVEVGDTYGRYNLLEGGTSDSRFIKSDNDTLKTIRFSNTVKYIGAYSFYLCENLTTIKFSENLLLIGEAAFMCFTKSNLKYLTFPSSLQTISKKAFYNTFNLENITFNAGLKEIGESAFEIYEFAASKTPQYLKTLMFGRELRTIGARAFMGRYSLKQVYWSELKTRNFNQYDGDKLVTLDLTDDDLYYTNGSTVSIGNYAFSLICLDYKLDSTEANSTDGMKDEEKGAQTDIIESSSLLEVQAEAGYFCRIILPMNVTYIGEYCFYGRRYTDFVFTDPMKCGNTGLTYPLTIGKCAFYIPYRLCLDPWNGGTGLNTTMTKKFNYYIKLPAHIVSIGDYAFRNRLLFAEGITFSSPETTSNTFDLNIGKGAFSNNRELAAYKYPKSVDDYFTITIPTICKTIGAYAFHEVYNIKNFTIAGADNGYSHLTTIEEYAFSINERLNDVPTANKSTVQWNFTLPKTLTVIGKRAFNQRGLLNVITIKGGFHDGNDSALNTIDEYAFYYSSVVYFNNSFPSSCVTFKRYAFARCTSLIGDANSNDDKVDRSSYLAINGAATTLSEGVFALCSNLNTVFFYDINTNTSKVKGRTIPDYFFYNCSKLNAVYFATDQNINYLDDTKGYYSDTKNYFGLCYQIGDLAFYKCTDLKYLYLDKDFCKTGSTSTSSGFKMKLIQICNQYTVTDSEVTYYGQLKKEDGSAIDLKEGNTSLGGAPYLTDDNTVKLHISMSSAYNDHWTFLADQHSGQRSYWNQCVWGRDVYNVSYKWGTQLGLAAFYGCRSMNIGAKNRVTGGLKCINPYTFYGCSNFGVGGTTTFNKIFNVLEYTDGIVGMRAFDKSNMYLTTASTGDLWIRTPWIEGYAFKGMNISGNNYYVVPHLNWDFASGSYNRGWSEIKFQTNGAGSNGAYIRFWPYSNNNRVTNKFMFAGINGIFSVYAAWNTIIAPLTFTGSGCNFFGYECYHTHVDWSSAGIVSTLFAYSSSLKGFIVNDSSEVVTAGAIADSAINPTKSETWIYANVKNFDDRANHFKICSLDNTKTLGKFGRKANSSHSCTHGKGDGKWGKLASLSKPKGDWSRTVDGADFNHGVDGCGGSKDRVDGRQYMSTNKMYGNVSRS